jgi:type II secretory pathway component PulF
MGTFSIWHWLIVLIVFAVPNIPAYWVLRKAGRNGWACLLLMIPLVGVVYLWMFAFGRWPNEPKKASP